MRARNQSCKVPAPASNSIFMVCLVPARRGTDQFLGFRLDVRRENYKTLLWDLLCSCLSSCPCLEIIWAKPQTPVDSPRLNFLIASRYKHKRRARRKPCSALKPSSWPESSLKSCIPNASSRSRCNLVGKWSLDEGKLPHPSLPALAAYG